MVSTPLLSHYLQMLMVIIGESHSALILLYRAIDLPITEEIDKSA